ncbi:MAG: putative DNA-binding domain-containing protein [Xanthomonadales bacterium]|nr:putative DNA-binding domain-containing protein [Xanthomonadales bacterium]
MSTLHTQLHALAAHVRDPAAHPGPPGIEDRRLAVYRGLVFDNLAGLLGNGFPVIRATLGDEAWVALVRRFLVEHACHTPLFPALAEEFVGFLADAQVDPARPWLPELAHYEWAEAGLQASDAQMPPHDPAGDLLDGIPVLSPLAWPLAYRWPVDRIGPDHQPTVAPDAPTLVLLRREATGAVRFAALSPLLYRLLASIAGNHGRSGRALLQSLASESGHADDDAFLAEAGPMLARLRAEDVIVGTRID